MWFFQVEEVTESNNNIENVKQTLLEHHSEFRRLTQQYDKLYEEHSRISQVRSHYLYCMVIYVNWEGRKKNAGIIENFVYDLIGHVFCRLSMAKFLTRNVCTEKKSQFNHIKVTCSFVGMFKKT